MIWNNFTVFVNTRNPPRLYGVLLRHWFPLAEKPREKFFNKCGVLLTPPNLVGGVACVDEYGNCDFIKAERRALKDLCLNEKIDFNLINIMTQPSLQITVERLLLAFFTSSH